MKLGQLPIIISTNSNPLFSQSENEVKTQVFVDISLNEEMFKAIDAGDLVKVKALIKSNRSLLEIKEQK